MPSPVVPSGTDATKYATEIYAEPGRIEVPVQAPLVCEGRQNKGFVIDFDALGRVLAHEDDEGQDNVQSQFYNEIRRQDNHRFSTTSTNLAKSQRIILYSPSFDSTFRATSFQELDIRALDLPHIFSEDEEHLWWMDVQNPSEKELRLLCSAFRIHPLTVEDILNREIQEKIEDFTNYYFACFRSYRATDTAYKPYTIYMVVFRAGTLSFCFSDSEHANHVLNRIELLKDYLSINSDWIFYAFV
jgi:Mg2+ and Co2+ transporter CorA